MLKLKTNFVPGWIFLALFPGFFFYNYLVANGYLEPVLGGYFGITAVALSPFAGLIYIRQLLSKRITLNRLDKMFLALMLYIISVATFHYINGNQMSVDIDLFQSSMATVLFNIILYLIARTVDLKSQSLQTAISASFVAMSVLIFINVSDRGMYQINIDPNAIDSVSTYQGLGRSLSVASIFALAMARSKFAFFVIGLLSFAALFFNGARSELVGTIVALFFMMIIKFKIRQLVLIVVALVLGAVLILPYLPIELIEKNRVFELMRLDDSSSALARSELMHEALRTIAAHPIFGDYGSYAYTSGVGSYSHNLLSAWVDLGIFGFVFYTACFLAMGTVIINKFRYRGVMNSPFVFAGGCYVFTALLMFFAKEYGYMFFGLTMALAARLIDFSRRMNVNTDRIQMRRYA